LGEIEATLSQHAAVKQAVVVLREDRPGDRRLVAYLVLDRAVAAPAREQLRDLLLIKLPEYMVPAAFLYVESLPLTPNGKVDRRALPAPDETSLTRSEEYAAPRDAVEEQIAELWAGLLGIPQIGIHESFFLLGGQSLLAARFISQARRRFQVDLKLRDIFEAPTIAGLASLVSRRCLQLPPGITSAEARAIPATSTKLDRRSDGPFPDTSSEQGAASAEGPGTEDLTELLFLRSREREVEYAKVFRNGEGRPPVVGLGDSRLVPLLLGKFPAAVPVVFLRIDGHYVWPPEELTIEQQVARYASALKDLAFGQRVCLVGFSYGGLLAYCLASVLRAAGWQVELVLLEPTFPVNALPWFPLHLKLKVLLETGLRKVRRVIRWLMAGSPAQALAAAVASADVPPAVSRWGLMAQNYATNVESVQLEPLNQRFGLVARNSVLSEEASLWRAVGLGEIEPCGLPVETGHIEVLRGP
ncbi:MAG: alpha/beta fold hydrolase, partial [Planctomycetes bacterium]|nr:alpha/beta fold hydrolase [Planctomycetota bacterium]